jgi:hypothetical protein
MAVRSSAPEKVARYGSDTSGAHCDPSASIARGHWVCRRPPPVRSMYRPKSTQAAVHLPCYLTPLTPRVSAQGDAGFKADFGLLPQFGRIRDTPHPEPGNPMATLGRRMPRIVCVRLGSARQLVELKVVRRLPSLWYSMEWAVVSSLG